MASQGSNKENRKRKRLPKKNWSDDDRTDSETSGERSKIKQSFHEVSTPPPLPGTGPAGLYVTQHEDSQACPAFSTLPPLPTRSPVSTQCSGMKELLYTNERLEKKMDRLILLVETLREELKETKDEIKKIKSPSSPIKGWSMNRVL